MKEHSREAGVLLPVSALPSPYGIGCFSSEAYDFVDMLCDGEQSVWQILPLCPTAFGDSPYQSPASFGGNPYFISLDALCEKGLLEKKDLPRSSDNGRVDYGRLYKERFPLLYKAFLSFESQTLPAEYKDFWDENKCWLDSTAFFMAIKRGLSDAPLSQLPGDLLRGHGDAIERAREELSREIAFQKFIQYEFFTQWRALKRYANSRGIKIMGDLPIYVSADSAEVWSRPELFRLDERLSPTAVAGCPPDAFSPDGQLWGNPLYAWETHKSEGFKWWKDRFSFALKNYDILRIDHFRGFEAYYSIPFGAENARSGRWEKGEGDALFGEIRAALPNAELVAEDLGFLTDGVRRLRDKYSLAGMKILQFGFDGEEEYLPYAYSENSVAYTGTHDNPTLKQWLEELSAESEARLRDYIKDRETPKEELAEKLVALAMMSPSRLCIVPMQDHLGVGREGRINTPASSGENWRWRMKKEDISETTAKAMRDRTLPYGRARKKRSDKK